MRLFGRGTSRCQPLFDQFRPYADFPRRSDMLAAVSGEGVMARDPV